MRMAGRKPDVVYIGEAVTQLVRDWHMPRTRSGIAMEPHTPRIAITTAERLEALDLRFLVGLEVRVSASTESRAKGLFEACKRAGAARVIGCALDDPMGWVEIFNKDTTNAS